MADDRIEMVCLRSGNPFDFTYSVQWRLGSRVASLLVPWLALDRWFMEIIETGCVRMRADVAGHDE